MGEKSKELFAKARNLIPGGVNSPVRAGKAVGLDPPFIHRAEGCFLWDVDGKRYIDYVCSWGPMILGHAHPDVVQALEERVPKGTSYGAPTALEVEMAGAIVDMIPSIEMVRMVNSGTEATMSAIRLARGFTGREKIVKFEGCYHGHADSLLVSAGSGVATFGIPGCPGVPADLAGHTLSLPFNDLEAFEKTMNRWGPEIAAVIVEPVPGNMGVIVPDHAFLHGLREMTEKDGILLIFDEVISGFRVSPGGAQGLYGIMPDLTCLGKIIGGGLPVGAYGGKRSVMARMAPEGEIYQAGTLSGNPLAMAAGLATLRALQKEGVYQQLEEKSQKLFSGLQEVAKQAGFDVVVNRVGSMGSLFFASESIGDFASVKRSDAGLFADFYAGMLEQGIYLAPSAFETWFVSTAHDEQSIEKTIDCGAKVFTSMGRNR
jgi:glutamate-1-semialdehyde 2,1-aminomutase